MTPDFAPEDRRKARVAALERLAVELRDHGVASRRRDTHPSPSLAVFAGGVEVVSVAALGRQFHIGTANPTVKRGRAMHPVVDPGGCARRVATRLRREVDGEEDR